MENTKHIEILLVEDNPADIRLTREAMKMRGSKNNLHVVNDGETAIDFLHKKGEYKNAVTPDVILLDMNLPKMTGMEVLKNIKNDPDLKMLPVIITSTSSHSKDIVDSYKNCANGYIVKPIDVDKFFKVINSLEDLWLEVMKLPTRID